MSKEGVQTAGNNCSKRGAQAETGNEQMSRTVEGLTIDPEGFEAAIFGATLEYTS
jgi:hypothetical protein